MARLMDVPSAFWIRHRIILILIFGQKDEIDTGKSPANA
jgi:hypothetical protein